MNVIDNIISISIQVGQRDDSHSTDWYRMWHLSTGHRTAFVAWVVTFAACRSACATLVGSGSGMPANGVYSTTATATVSPTPACGVICDSRPCAPNGLPCPGGGIGPGFCIGFGPDGACVCVPECPTAPPTPVATATVSPTPPETPTLGSCAGDCDHNGRVTVDEILRMVSVALGESLLSECQPGDSNSDGLISVDEIIGAVNAALNGCSSSVSQFDAIHRAASGFATRGAPGRTTGSAQAQKCS